MAMQNRIRISEEQETEIGSLLFSSYLNMSLIYMKQEKHLRAVEVLTSALSLQNSVKALVRRASCFIQLQEPEKAEEDLKVIRAMDHGEFSVEVEQLSKKAKNLQNSLSKNSGFNFKKLF